MENSTFIAVIVYSLFMTYGTQQTNSKMVNFHIAMLNNQRADYFNMTVSMATSPSVRPSELFFFLHGLQRPRVSSENKATCVGPQWTEGVFTRGPLWLI